MQNRNDEQDPYDRPQSADPRRERDRNNDRDRRSGRNRKSSPSPAGLRGIMKKNFEMSDTGITSGALGMFNDLKHDSSFAPLIPHTSPHTSPYLTPSPTSCHPQTTRSHPRR